MVKCAEQAQISGWFQSLGFSRAKVNRKWEPEGRHLSVKQQAVLCSVLFASGMVGLKDSGVLVGREVGGGFRANNVLIENLQGQSLSGERGRSTVSHSNKERRKPLCVI